MQGQSETVEFDWHL